MIKDVRKIAILRANGLGDLILTFPAIEALRKAYPEAEIVIIGRKLHQEFLQKRKEFIDRVIPIPHPIQFNSSLLEPSEEKSTFFESLQHEQFDIGIQLHGGGQYSNVFMQKMKTKISIGARTPEALPLDINFPYTQFQHEILRQLEIVQGIGARSVTFVPQLRSHIPFSPEFILINPGATDPKRRWPPEEFITLTESLVDQGHQIIINFGPNESRPKQKFSEHFSGNKNVRINSPSISELESTIARCKLVISNDTGTLHLALAMGIPTVGIFWFRNLLNYGPMNSFLNRILISWQTECPVCKKNCCLENLCQHEESLVKEVGQASVLNAALELLMKNDQRSQYAL